MTYNDNNYKIYKVTSSFPRNNIVDKKRARKKKKQERKTVHRLYQMQNLYFSTVNKNGNSQRSINKSILESGASSVRETNHSRQCLRQVETSLTSSTSLVMGVLSSTVMSSKQAAISVTCGDIHFISICFPSAKTSSN